MATSTTPIVDEVRKTVTTEMQAEYEARFAKEIVEFKEKLEGENKIAIDAAIADFKKSQQPPSPEEITTLLNQEYLKFKVTVPWDEPADGSEGEADATREFVIQELPQKTEKKFYKMFKEVLIPRAEDIAAITFELLEGDAGKKIIAVLETFDPTFDLMAETCVMILDPKGKNSITMQWIQNNISSYRQWNIIYAQVEVNRLRDFFSQLSRSSKGMPTNLGHGTRS
jgi:hypothetical protein